MANIQPNRYTLKSADGNTKVTYESNLLGQPELVLTQSGAAARTFIGPQVRSATTEIGTLVTVTTFATIDTGSTSFSLLIPAIGLANASTQVAFSTDAIVTSHKGPDSFPMTGAFETYQFIALQGEASFVLTLAESALAQLAKSAATK